MSLDVFEEIPKACGMTHDLEFSSCSKVPVVRGGGISEEDSQLHLEGDHKQLSPRCGEAVSRFHIPPIENVVSFSGRSGRTGGAFLFYPVGEGVLSFRSRGKGFPEWSLLRPLDGGFHRYKMDSPVHNFQERMS